MTNTEIKMYEDEILKRENAKNNVSKVQEKTLSDVEKLNELLNKYDILHLTKKEELINYFDVTELDADNCPLITCEHKTVIFTDNELFNETYLIDVINEFLSNPTFKNIVDFVYINDFDIRKHIICNSRDIEDMTKQQFEKTYLPPYIFTLNPDTNEFLSFRETIVPFDLEAIKNIIKIVEF